MAGYSGTPLARKLGIVPGGSVVTRDAPPELRSWLEPLPADVSVATTGRKADVVIAFFVWRSELQESIDVLGRVVFPAGGLWIAWPKKAAKLASDMNENVVRDVALPKGLVDNKVCAISEVWSGLRLVWRKHLRT